MITENIEENSKFKVKLDMNQEYMKHKRALCMLKTVKDIGFEWDLAFCKYMRSI
jgi:hypothetical protein